MILIGGFAVVLVFGAAFGSRIYDRFTKSDASNLESRLGMNAIALRMIAANPVLGTGPNNYALNLPRYDVKGFMDDYPAPVHNLYLLEAAEAGIPGLLLFVALMGAILMAATQRLPRMHDRELQWIVAALVAGLIGILFAQISDFSFRLEPLRSMIWLEVGLLFGVLQVDRIPRVAGHGAATG
jgi:O-antigen ligase